MNSAIFARVCGEKAASAGEKFEMPWTVKTAEEMLHFLQTEDSTEFLSLKPFVNPGVRFGAPSWSDLDRGGFAKEDVAAGTLLIMEIPMCCIQDGSKADFKILSRLTGVQALKGAPAFESQDFHLLFNQGSVIEEAAEVTEVNVHDIQRYNSFTSPSTGATILVGFSSLLNHSCEANAAWHTVVHMGKDVMFYVRAAKNIPKGTEICLAYTCNVQPSLIRGMFLTSQDVVCGCNRCVKESQLPVEVNECISSHADAFEDGATVERKIHAYAEILQVAAYWGCADVVLPSLGALALNAGLKRAFIVATAGVSPGDHSSLQVVEESEEEDMQLYAAIHKRAKLG